MNKRVARSLRRRMTSQEVKLWMHLRAYREQGFHFRRQAPRAGYVVDFACLKHKIVVELDGGQHNFDAHAARDRVRDERLAAQGFLVLRFWNNDIDGNLPGVIERINEVLAQR